MKLLFIEDYKLCVLKDAGHAVDVSAVVADIPHTGPGDLMSGLIAAVYLAGGRELRRYHADTRALGAALAEAPNVEIPAAEVVDGLLPAYDDLFARVGLAASKSAARRTIDEGGAYANNVRVTDPAAQAAIGDLHHGEWLVLRRGKKAFAGVRVASS